MNSAKTNFKLLEDDIQTSPEFQMEIRRRVERNVQLSKLIFDIIDLYVPKAVDALMQVAQAPDNQMLPPRIEDEDKA